MSGIRGRREAKVASFSPPATRWHKNVPETRTCAWASAPRRRARYRVHSPAVDKTRACCFRQLRSFELYSAVVSYHRQRNYNRCKVLLIDYLRKINKINDNFYCQFNIIDIRIFLLLKYSSHKNKYYFVLVYLLLYLVL